MTPKRTILVVDDDERTVEIIRLRLESDGFTVITAGDGDTALARIRTDAPDLVVLDLMLPVLDGLDICHILRVEGESDVPIIMLTARTTEDDRLRGLTGGADDYLTKPFSPRELSARVTAVLRRAAPADSAKPSVICRGDLTIDLQRVEATLGGHALHLTPTEFTLLVTLASEPERAFTRLQLLHRLFGYTYDGLERTVDVHVANLRKKLDAGTGGSASIATVYGVGYRFAETRDSHDAGS